MHIRNIADQAKGILGVAAVLLMLFGLTSPAYSGKKKSTPAPEPDIHLCVLVNLNPDHGGSFLRCGH